MAFRPRRTSRALLAPLTVLALATGPVLVAGGAAAATRPATARPAAARPAALDPGLPTAGARPVKVVVTGRSVALARAAAVAAGATRVRPLALVDGVAATVPAGRLTRLARAAGVTAVTADRALHLAGSAWDTSLSASPYAWTSQAVPTWQQTGNRGTGIGIAVLDTGVSPVGDLAGRLVQGPDLSGEGNNTRDSYGHGTVMAGIAAGDGTAAGSQPLTGVAPGANVIAVKVAGGNGATDVSTVLAGLTWVAAFKDTYNIRVLNLSWGVPSTQDPAIDPLDFAVERLWNLGVTVVVAAGNAGPSTGTVLKPGDDPLVLTVGAYDDKGDAVAANDSVPAWSSQGPTAQGRAKPDLVAPGRTLVATRAPGSTVEAQNPDALVGSAYIKGSGTSEATAVTSGAAALVLAAHPTWTPDQVKYALTSTATRVNATPSSAQGAGRLQALAALGANPLLAPVQVSTAVGTGTLDGSRGQAALVSVTCPDGVSRVVAGNATTWCAPFDIPTWASSAWTSSAWTSSAWTSSAWTSSAWTSSAWTSSAWTSSAWTSSAWTSSAWTSSAWTSSAWTSSAWTSSAWTSSAWTSSAWTSSAWTSSAWTGDSWGTGDSGDFQTAFYGDRPRFGHRVAGEVSELLPDFALGNG